MEFDINDKSCVEYYTKNKKLMLYSGWIDKCQRWPFTMETVEIWENYRKHRLSNCIFCGKMNCL